MGITNLIAPAQNGVFYSTTIPLTQARTFNRESEPDIKIQCDTFIVVENPIDGLDIAFSPEMMDAPITIDIHKEDNLAIWRGKIQGIWLQHSNTSSTPLTILYGNGVDFGHQHKSVDIFTVNGTQQTADDWTARFKTLNDDSVKGLMRSVGDAGATPTNSTGKTVLQRLADIQTDTANIKTDLDLTLPVTQATRHNFGYTAGADLFASAITPLTTPCKITLEFAHTVAGKLSAKITNGGNTQTIDLNEAINLTGSALYKFDVYLASGDTLNFTYNQNGTVMVARAIEVDANL